jgi:hypothetical protein
MCRRGVILFLFAAFFYVDSFKLNNHISYKKKSFLQLNNNFQSNEYFQDLNVIHNLKKNYFEYFFMYSYFRNISIVLIQT